MCHKQDFNKRTENRIFEFVNRLKTDNVNESGSIIMIKAENRQEKCLIFDEQQAVRPAEDRFSRSEGRQHIGDAGRIWLHTFQ